MQVRVSAQSVPRKNSPELAPAPRPASSRDELRTREARRSRRPSTCGSSRPGSTPGRNREGKGRRRRSPRLLALRKRKQQRQLAVDDDCRSIDRSDGGLKLTGELVLSHRKISWAVMGNREGMPWARSRREEYEYAFSRTRAFLSASRTARPTFRPFPIASDGEGRHAVDRRRCASYCAALS